MRPTRPGPGALDKFAGGDQAYLRDVQYRDEVKLRARAALHIRYGTGPVPWFAWLAGQVVWPDSAEVLEVGCGPGWMWVEAAGHLPAGLRLTLTDYSPGMAEAAGDRVGGLGRFARVRTEVVDAQLLPFSDQSFDVVVANHMLYHVPDPAGAVAELSRVLRPGGTLLAATNGPANHEQLWEINAKVFGVPATSAATARFGSVTGLPILRRSFAAVQWRSYPDELRCTDPEDVIAYLTSFPPGEDAVPQALDALRHEVLTRFGGPERVFTITKDTGAFVATEPHHAVRAR